MLQRQTAGVLAVSGDDGYHAVPLSYVYQDGKLFFTAPKPVTSWTPSSTTTRCPSAWSIRIRLSPSSTRRTFATSLSLAGRGYWTMRRKSGRPFESLAAKYSPDLEQGRLEEIERQYDHVCMVELSIEHMTGKEAIELVRARHNVGHCPARLPVPAEPKPEAACFAAPGGKCA